MWNINENVCNEIKKPESREDECIASRIYLSHLIYLIFKLSRKCIANGVLVRHRCAKSHIKCASIVFVQNALHLLLLSIYMKRCNRPALYKYTLVTVAERHEPSRCVWINTHTHTNCNYTHSNTTIKYKNKHAKHNLMYSPVTYRTTFVLSLFLVCTKASCTIRSNFFCTLFVMQFLLSVCSVHARSKFICLPHQ